LSSIYHSSNYYVPSWGIRKGSFGQEVHATTREGDPCSEKCPYVEQVPLYLRGSCSSPIFGLRDHGRHIPASMVFPCRFSPKMDSTIRGFLLAMWWGLPRFEVAFSSHAPNCATLPAMCAVLHTTANLKVADDMSEYGLGCGSKHGLKRHMCRVHAPYHFGDTMYLGPLTSTKYPQPRSGDRDRPIETIV